MIRKILTSGVLAAGTLAGLTVSPSSADAHPPAVGPAYIPVVRPGYYPPGGHDWHHRVRFEVLVRHHGHAQPGGVQGRAVGQWRAPSGARSERIRGGTADAGWTPA